MGGDAEWWRDAAVLQIYPRSFADADGDGVGDLDGVTARLPYVAALGVDAVWLTPFQRSPQADHGYDVSDYCDVDPLFGDLGALDRLLGRAHDLGLRVIVDLVPNHCSSAHPLFAAALAAGPGSSERDRFHFAPGRGPDGAEPPNNWPSVFGGPAWTRRARRRVVPAPVRARATRLELARPADVGVLRRRPAVLVRPRLRRGAHRRGARAVQGAGPARPVARGSGGRHAGAPACGPARVRPGGGARALPALAGAGRLRTTRHARSSARSTSTRTARPATPARTSCTRPSRSASSPHPGTPQPGATSARNCWRHGCRAVAR